VLEILLWAFALWVGFWIIYYLVIPAIAYVCYGAMWLDRRVRMVESDDERDDREMRELDRRHAEQLASLTAEERVLFKDRRTPYGDLIYPELSESPPRR
jgi:hypothetical protein